MARPQSTSNARALRNGKPQGRGRAPRRTTINTALLTADSFGPSLVGAQTIEQAIENERGRLSHAQSVLKCLRNALLHAEDSNGGEPGYAEVAEIALKLIRESVHRLDSVYLRTLTTTKRRAQTPRRKARELALARK